MRRRLAVLALGAIGVVYGDIGTSPLYTLQVTLTHDGMKPTPESIFGVLSLIFWAQILVVSLKYVVFIMRADNKGEGGIMALMALAQRSVRDRPNLRWVLAILGIFGASLFYGDGVITPAISVLSAVEGVKVVAPHLSSWVVPVTLVILLALFAIQRRGTEHVGRLFGPIMVMWFIVIALLGLRMIARNPHVLLALDPMYGVRFFELHGFQGFIALGGVVLALTGAEALYADMGHFGKKPIRLAWFSFVLPALVLNYFGQGALLLSDPSAIDSPFFRLAPDILKIPMIALACVATVIASQAVISGAFSMTREAMSLGYSPRMAVVHTSNEMSGQVFVPWVNYFLLIMVMLAVLGFRSSENLSAAYGIAVTGTMAITSLLALVVARFQWGWNRFVVIGIGAVFLVIDLAFFSANLIKIEYGGWFPLALGVVVFAMMTTWRRGRELVLREIKQSGLALKPFIQNIGQHPPLRVPGTAVFLTGNQHSVPHALLHNLKHNKVLHERNVLLTVEMLETPLAETSERINLIPLGDEFYGLELHFGFAEYPNIPLALMECGREGLSFDMMDTTFFLSRENIVADRRRPGMALWRDKLFVFMARNALPATAFFQIPGNRLIELAAQLDDEALEATIRPRRLAEYLGQQAVREQLSIYIEAARKRGGALDHVLIFGPPGLGKTTLSHVIANELGVNVRSTSGPVLERAGDLAALLTNLEANDVLFVDEIHRLSPVVEEVLYPAMEDFQIDIMIGEGPAARSIKLDLPPFTLIGATTRAGMLTAPLRDRFGIVQRLEFYSTEELTAIVRRAARILGIGCAPEGAMEIARRSRGTPRIANRLLRRVRDYAEVRADGEITLVVAQAALDMLKIDPQGFDELDRRLLSLIVENFDGGPVGVESLAAALSEDRGTLEDVVEPFLIQQGYLVRTARGRMVSAKGWRHLGLVPPPRQVQAIDLLQADAGDV